jgi:hypothetical protein
MAHTNASEAAGNPAAYNIYHTTRKYLVYSPVVLIALPSLFFVVIDAAIVASLSLRALN